MTNPPTQPGETRLLQQHMPELDVLRGCAILGVLFYHGFYWSYSGWPNPLIHALIKATVGGWLGVNLFFVLSGFLITGILLDTKQKPGYYRRFYLRRVLRILPAYVAMIAVLMFARWLSWGSALICLLFLANYSSIFQHLHLGIYRPFWSLAVEEQFYLLWPAVVGNISARALTLLSLAICIVEPVLRWISVSSHHSLGDFQKATYLIADNLALGALAAIFARSQYGTRSNDVRLGTGLCLLAMVVLAVGYPFGILHRDNVVGDALQTVPWNLLFTGVLILLLGLRSPFFAGQLVAPLRFFGNISYGLYLVHVLIFVRYDDHVALLQDASLKSALHHPLVRFALCCGTAVLLAWLSRTFYEERFLRMGGAPSQPATVTVTQTPVVSS